MPKRVEVNETLRGRMNFEGRLLQKQTNSATKLQKKRCEFTTRKKQAPKLFKNLIWDGLGLFWALLGPSSALLGLFFAVLGLSWAVLGFLGGVLGFLGYILEAFCASWRRRPVRLRPTRGASGACTSLEPHHLLLWRLSRHRLAGKPASGIRIS